MNGTPKFKNSLVAAVITTSSGGGGGGSSLSPDSTNSPQATPTLTPSPSPSMSPTPTPSPTPEPDGDTLGQVVINEIAWMGTSALLSNDEWMELYNTTNQTVDLTGWTLKSLTGTSPDPQITLSGSIGPFGFYLLERTDDTTVSDISADKTYTGALSDTGEMLELRDAFGVLQDKILGDSGWYAGNKNTRSSMERVNPKQSGDNSANWATNNGTTKNGHDATGNPINGTPRAQNSIYVALAPSAITDLVATLNSPLTISWSAPDPGSFNTASLSYDLRYSTTIFSDAASASWWSAATQVASSSLPNVDEKGAPQSAFFNVVHEYGQTLYFALKTKVIHIPTCEVGNGGTVDKCSDISNIGQVSFPIAIDANSWAMLGKDQYHTSFAANIVGPSTTATISWTFEAIGAVSQPVVSAAGNVIFGASDGTLANSKIYSVSASQTSKIASESWYYGTNVSIGTPAVLFDGTVYFGRIGAGGSLVFPVLNSGGTNKWD